MQNLPISAAQCRMARAALRWSLDDLAQGSGVGRATIARFELGDAIKPTTASRLRETLERARVRFVDDGPFAGAVFLMRAASG